MRDAVRFAWRHITRRLACPLQAALSLALQSLAWQYGMVASYLQCLAHPSIARHLQIGLSRLFCLPHAVTQSTRNKHTRHAHGNTT